MSHLVFHDHRFFYKYEPAQSELNKDLKASTKQLQLNPKWQTESKPLLFPNQTLVEDQHSQLQIKKKKKIKKPQLESRNNKIK